MPNTLSTKRPAVGDDLLTNKRRKGRNFIDPASILKGMEGLTPDGTVAWVKDLMLAAIAMDTSDLEQQERKPKQKVLASSSLEMPDVKHWLQIHYNQRDPACKWNVTSDKGGLRVGTTWFELASQEITYDRNWGLETCEALTRTIVDLLLFDRMRLLEGPSSLHALRLVGEYSILTKTHDDLVVINGCCDYVLGYGGTQGGKNLDFGLVGVEVKKRYTLGTTSTPLIAYLVGLQQKLKDANKIVPFVYGIATDGVDFLFYRLNDKLELQSALVSGSDGALIYKYIDVIIESTVRVTPNTSPNTNVPSSAADVELRVENPLRRHPIPVAKGIVKAEKSDFVIITDKNGKACLQPQDEEDSENGEAEHDI